MSPEQLTGKPVTRSWDLWALAVIVYEMLSGACPFGTTELVATLHAAILSGHCAPIQTYVPEAPVRWQEFFTRSLTVEAARRPSSASELLAECEKAFA
jgi:serine/threonine-protein kinase